MNNEQRKYLLISTIVLTSIGGVVYGFYLLFGIFGNPIDKAFGSVFLFLLIVNAVFNIAGCYYYLKSFVAIAKYRKPTLVKAPPVAVVVPFRNEKPGTVEKTLASLKRLKYPGKIAFYTIDNSSKPDKKTEKFCKENGIRYKFLLNPVRLKSYALNNTLPEIKEEYLAIFDADDVLTDENFLMDTMGHFEKDPALGSVQTHKRYAPGGLFANTVNSYYSFFYNFIQPVRGIDKSGMFCGSVGIVRKSVVEKIGGFPNSPTEDTAFSFEADLAGYGGAFVPKTYALGEPIESFATFVAQQWRYTVGNSWLIKSYVRNLPKIPLHKQLHYSTQVFSFMYLSYLFILYALITLVFVLTNLSNVVFYQSLIIPEMAKFIAVSYLIAVVGMTMVGAQLYFGSYRIGLMVLFINFSVAIMRAKAVIVALFNLPTTFVMTRQNPNSMTRWEILRFTYAETIFAAVLIFFSVLSLLKLDMVGGFWLFWYGWLFSSSIIFAYSTDVNREEVVG
ncbi:MAG: glycosyltransferase family 2 protein [Candidatus Micrarchaeota archaeon]